jgi:uncharacterized membrane protein
MTDQGNSRNGDKPPTPNNAPSPAAQNPGMAVDPEVIPSPLDIALRSVGIDPKDPNISRALQISLTMMYSGTLPFIPPPILREYRNIRPELIDKLIQWTEDQAKHRRDLEHLRTQGSERRLDRGQHIGAIVALGGLVLAAIVGIYGNMWAAIAIAVVAVGGPTAAIVLARIFGPSTPPGAPQPPTTPG